MSKNLNVAMMTQTPSEKLVPHSFGNAVFDFSTLPLFSPNDFDLSAFFSDEYIFLPGFCDVHVHFRQPGFSYKETIKSGSLAAAHGGFTDVCTMPNLSPVPDCVQNLRVQADLIKTDAVIGVHPYGTITMGQAGNELSKMEELTSAIAFSDDGKGVQEASMMRAAMQKAKSLGKIIVAHCEVNELLHGGYIHDGDYCHAHGHRGICSQSEYLQIERDIRLAKETGAAYHVCHISTWQSVELIRRAKADGVDITCETAPHYLIFSDDELKDEGRFKMNPPIRSALDRKALLDGICDGTIDMIATDHAPHSAQEKSQGLSNSLFGVVGLETAFSALYTHLVMSGKISLERLIELMCHAPRRRFCIPQSGFSVWHLDKKHIVDTDEFLSLGRSTPFEGMELFGECVLTVYNKKIAYKMN